MKGVSQSAIIGLIAYAMMATRKNPILIKYDYSDWNSRVTTKSRNRFSGVAKAKRASRKRRNQLKNK